MLIFHEGLELPAFAAFDLLKDEAGTETLRRYYAPYVAEAASRGLGFVAESPTWRASPRWAAELGYGASELDGLQPARDRADGGAAGRAPARSSSAAASGRATTATTRRERLSADAAEAYHSTQIATFADTAADMVTAITMTYAEEAIGVTRAAVARGPAGRDLVHGRDRRPAAQRPDAGRGYSSGRRVRLAPRPAYYMINCAHPTHFETVLEDELVRERVRGLRANASDPQPRRARRGHRARRGRSGRPRGPLRAA